MPILEIIKLIAIAIIVLALAIYYVVKAVKNGWLEKLTKTINEAIKDAESTELTGSEKKAYVLSQVELKSEELGIPYALIRSLLSKLIDTIIKNYNIIAK